WATVGLSSLPKDTAAGDTWAVDLTVLQHGRKPLEGIAPVLTIANGDGDSRQFVGTPAGKPGVYHVDVVFPSSGTWSYQVWDDFSQTHTYKPVEIAALDPGSFPTLPLTGGILAALALGAALLLFLRRDRHSRQPVGLKEAV
nr:hypothetical protein [Actinomycetota bacterium]